MGKKFGKKAAERTFPKEIFVCTDEDGEALESWFEWSDVNGESRSRLRERLHESCGVARYQLVDIGFVDTPPAVFVSSSEKSSEKSRDKEKKR